MTTLNSLLRELNRKLAKLPGQEYVDAMFEAKAWCDLRAEEEQNILDDDWSGCMGVGNPPDGSKCGRNYDHTDDYASEIKVPS